MIQPGTCTWDSELEGAEVGDHQSPPCVCTIYAASLLNKDKQPAGKLSFIAYRLRWPKKTRADTVSRYLGEYNWHGSIPDIPPINTPRQPMTSHWMEYICREDATEGRKPCFYHPRVVPRYHIRRQAKIGGVKQRSPES